MTRVPQLPDASTRRWLAARGFAAGASRGGHRWLADDAITLHPEPGWARLEARGGDAPLGSAGLWREVPTRSREGTHRVFDLPPLPTAAPVPLGHVDALLAWALATRHGRPPAGWQAPAAATPPAAGQLTVRVGGLAAQGEVSGRDSDRCAVMFPLLGRRPQRLGRTRGRLVDQLLADAGRRWRLARVAAAPDGTIAAEIDLTGAPAAHFEPLLTLATTALATVVEWLLPPLALLLDPNVHSRALGPVPNRSHDHERTAHHA